MKRIGFLCAALFALFSLSLADDKNDISSNSIEIGELTSKEAESLLFLLQALISEGYAEDKLGVISELVHTFTEDSDTANLTLVGSQNVYNEDGTLKEIRTIELAIPMRHEKSVIDFNVKENEDKKFDLADFDKVVDVRDTIKGLSRLAFDMEFFYLNKDKDGEVDQAFYVNKNLQVLKYEGFNYMNKTIEVANKQMVEDALKDMKKEFLPISRLNFDKDGNFLKEGSTVVPEYLVSVESDFGEPKQEIIDAALKAVAKASLETKSRDEVPKKIQAYMEEKVPGTVFFVTADEPTGEYVNKDFSLSLSYDLTDFNEYVSYSVYGYKIITG